MVYEYFKLLVNDFDAFVDLHVENIWTVLGVIFAWPVYLPYLFFAWLFGF